MNYFCKSMLSMAVLSSVTSCVANRDLGLGGGGGSARGGFRVVELEPDKYSILIKTNAAPVENFPAALSAWHKRAKQACKGRRYEAEDIEQSSYELHYRFLEIPYITSQVTGYAHCEK
jgi:hypothetical protein